MQIEQIWANYKHHLKGFLKSKIADPDEVEDVLQEVLIKVHHNLATIDRGDRLEPWLWQITRNTLIDHYRRQAVRHKHESEGQWWDDENPSVRAELARCIAPFIRDLPEQYQSLLEAIELQGRSQKALAEELDIPYSTLKSQVQKGRTLLKQVFETCCHYELDARGNLMGYHRKGQGCSDC